MQESLLTDLDAFAAVAQARSFRGAASLRGASASSLSDAIRRLEARLGVRLLNRTTRSVTPTEVGARLVERLIPALGEVAAALDIVNAYRDSPTGTLRLNVPVVAALTFLPPLAEAFLVAHPGIMLDIVAEDTFIDVLGAGFDAGVRYDERIEQDMIAVPIGPRSQRYVTVASPAYISTRGRPAHPKDLLDHDCIRHRFASGVLLSSWDFERGGETVRVSPTGPLIATTSHLEISAAVAGLGLITTFEDFVRAALDDGRLVAVLEDWTPDFSGPFLYYASRRHMPAPLRAFVDFIKSRP